jgi:hypothetical protein
MQQPCVQIGLQSFHRLIERGAESNAEEFIQHGALEAFYNAVGLGPTYLGVTMLDVIELQVELIGMIFLATKFTLVVGQHHFHGETPGLVEGEHIVMQDRCSGFGLLGSVQEAEGLSALIEATSQFILKSPHFQSQGLQGYL